MPACQYNPVLKLPITIGTYPIQDTAEGYTGYEQPSAPLLSDQNTSIYPGAPSAPFSFPNDGKIKF